ncbi:beta-mannosidase [Dyadobacter jejuensis]|uniref:Beta-mannosidase B n=1 Tax=Dyadobacter jejuensis TaxID=1082580 RepID=A0A316AK34_9BACT|nr:sugar-binding domain-containing protein [Dyadobacter jejuensis]PWJ58016.1 beta-mannosidase [Dyadobacter jejuensis]
MRICIFIICLLATQLAAWAQPQTSSFKEGDTQQVRDLSGFRWKMKMMLPGEGEKAGLDKLPPEDIETLVWNIAQVPGDVYTDLWKNGVIEDPYFGRNASKAQWVSQYEWWYATQFNVTDDLANKMTELKFEGVDYSCDIWLNGHYMGKHEGAFSSFSYDVTKYLRSSKKTRESSNMLMIRLNPPPKVNALVAGRKTPWFGDYWRDVIPFGITRPVKLFTTGASSIKDVYAKTTLLKDGSAKVDLQLEIENFSGKTLTLSALSEITGENFSSEIIKRSSKINLKPGINKVVHSYDIPKPKLWWPWDLGEQNLYKAKISIGQNGVNQDFVEEVFGIRVVKMEWNPGFTREEVSFPRTTTINGKFHFIRSACWGGPPDIFVGRTSVAEYKTLIDLAKKANMNNIRIFGWHPPEIPEFYELCDRAGLTVWQDVIPFGTGNIPQDEVFLNKAIQEGIAVIKERRNHPSLIMMEGGEEMMLRTRDPKFTRRFLEQFGDSLQQYVDLPYVPDSPLTDEASMEAGFKPKEAVHALGYFYNMGNWLLEDWYKSLDYPIVPELAITSVPSVKSLKKFIPENEMWPPGLSWGYHWADLDKLRMQNYDAFNDEKTGSLEEFVNATQDSQGIIFQLSVEHFRRNKPRLSGIALCHFITYWPDMKWGIVDNYQEPKRSFDYVQTAYQPLLVNLNFEKRRWKTSESFKGEVWVVNDLYKDFPGAKVKLEIKNDRQEVIYSETKPVGAIEGNSAKKMFSLEEKVLGKVEKQFYVTLKLIGDKDQALSHNDYLFLIGDQQEASKKFKQMGKEMKQKIATYGAGNYFEYFPDVNGEGEQKMDSDMDTPRARGFENKK